MFLKGDNLQELPEKLFGILPSFLGRIFVYKLLVISEFVKESKSVIDIGCGEGDIMASLIGRSNLYKVGLDAYTPYINSCKKRKLYDEYIISDVKDLGKNVAKRRFDTVLCLEVIEHLEKEDGYRLLNDLENIANKQIILSTPVGFHKIHMYDNSKYQFHRSGWLPKEFRKRGYKVYGTTGFRFLRGERAGSLFNNLILKTFNSILSYTSQIICFYIPELAWGMVAVKNL